MAREIPFLSHSIAGEGLSARVGAALESCVWAFRTSSFPVSLRLRALGLGSRGSGLSCPAARGTLPDLGPQTRFPRDGRRVFRGAPGRASRLFSVAHGIFGVACGTLSPAGTSPAPGSGSAEA